MNPAGRTDNWFTPMGLFRELHAAWRFTLDPCAHPDSPVSQFMDENGGRTLKQSDDGLGVHWRAESVFCNPPYSDIEPWAAKAHLEIRGGCHGIAMLVPANRTEQPWWQTFVERYRDGKAVLAGPRVSTLFLPKRLRFGFPGDPTGRTGHQPTFGCVVIVWRPQ